MLSEVVFERPPHLYFITSRPRMTVDPSEVHVDPHWISGRVRRQLGPVYDFFEFRVPHPYGDGITFTTQWPHERFELHGAGGELVADGLVANLGIASRPEQPLESIDFEVLYVGQAYGSSGERLAPERLKSHGTLQRILADCAPDKQIWLLLASISDEAYMIEMDKPNRTATKSDEENRSHEKLVIATVDDPNFREYHAVNVAEAGLIRYFRPLYNEVFKNNFPHSRYKMLDTLRKLDLLGLIIELQGQNIPVSLWSEAVGTARNHVAEYGIHLDGPSRATDWAWLNTFVADG